MKNIQFRKRERRYPAWQEEVYFNMGAGNPTSHLIGLHHIAEVRCARNKKTIFPMTDGSYWVFLLCTAQEAYFLPREGGKQKLFSSSLMIKPPRSTPGKSGGFLLEKDPDNPCIRYYLGIERNTFTEQMFQLEKREILTLQEPEKVFAIVKEILSFPKEDKPVTREELSVLLFKLLTFIACGREKISDFSSPYAKLIDDVRHYPQNYPTLRSLQKAFNVSRETLRKIFLEATSLSPMGFVVKSRLLNSCWMLRSSTLSIREIAEINGYKSTAFFSAAFKKMFDISPMEFRKSGILKKHPPFRVSEPPAAERL